MRFKPTTIAKSVLYGRASINLSKSTLKFEHVLFNHIAEEAEE